MPHAFDVISVGDAKIDEFLLIHAATAHFRLNKETNELCIKSGEKITVDKYDMVLGGNAANVAVGTSRLGLKASICAEIGDDEFSHKILNTLKKENVDTQFIKQSHNKPSSLSVIINFQNDRTIFSEHIRRSHDFSFDVVSTQWIYLTSLGKEWKNTYQKTYEFVKQKSVKLAFNPGTLQLAAGYDSIAKVLSLTDILFLNKEEAEELTSSNQRLAFSYDENKDSLIKQLLLTMQKLGPKVVVITDGENGSYALDEKGQMFTHGIVNCKVVEKTGAGDAYSTGFLAATLHGLPIKQAMSWGAVNSASVIGKVGAQSGLLRKSEMEKN